MKNKLVSVIIPCFNRSDLILETIKSILNQSYSNIEVICIDDFSSDNTVKKLRTIKDERLKIIKLKSNNGRPSVPRNIGILKSKGYYLAFCDDDDIWHKNKLHQQINFIYKKKLDIIYTDFEYLGINKSKNLIFKLIRKTLPHSLIFTNSILNSSVLMKRSVYDSVGIIDENHKLRAIEDYQYWLRLYFNNMKFGFLNKVLVKYRVHENRISDSDEGLALREIMVKSLRKYLTYKEYLVLKFFQKLYKLLRI